MLRSRRSSQIANGDVPDVNNIFIIHRPQRGPERDDLPTPEIIPMEDIERGTPELLPERPSDSQTTDSEGLQDNSSSLSHLQTLLQLLPYLALIPITTKPTGRRQVILTRLQQTCFVVFASLSLVQAVLISKLAYRDDSNRSRIVAIGKALFVVLLKVTFIMTFSVNHKKIQELLRIQIPHLDKRGKPDRYLVPILLGVSVATSLMVVMSWAGVFYEAWDANYIIQDQSETMEWAFGVSISPSSNSTTTFSISSFARVSFAILALISDFCGEVMGYIIPDLFLVHALTVHESSRLFIKVTLSQTTEDQQGVFGRDTLSNFKILKNICEKFDDALGNLYKLLHGNILFLLAYVVHELLVEKKVTLLKYTSVYIIKSGVAYYCACKSARVNSLMQKLIQEDPRAHFPDLSPCELGLVKSEVKRRPVGIGYDAFHIDETFIGKVAAFVLSYFMLLAEEK